MNMRYQVVVQPRHVHLSQVDHDLLFGSETKLTPMRSIGHLGQDVYQETVTLVGKNGIIESVRIIGPIREKTQIELSELDAVAAGIQAPLRLSGDSQNAGFCRLLGPKGECTVENVIIPARHLHLPDQLARRHGLRQHQRVRLIPCGHPGQSIKEVVVRVHPTFSPEFHLTSDEAATFWLQTGDQIIIA